LQPDLRLSWTGGPVPSLAALPLGPSDDEAMTELLQAIAKAGAARLSDSKQAGSYYLPKALAALGLMPAGLDEVRTAALMHSAIQSGRLVRENNKDGNRKPYVALKLRNFAAAAQGAQGS